MPLRADFFLIALPSASNGRQQTFLRAIFFIFLPLDSSLAEE